MPARRLPHGSKLAALLALLAALALGACGGEDAATTSDDGPDPATLAPADAFLYAEIVVRPTGEVEQGARAALRKVLRIEDPGAEIVRLLDRGFADEGDDITYADDLEPWLGERGGGWMRFPAGGSADDPDWAIALAADDVEALEEADARFRDEGIQRRAGTYKGVSYDLDQDGESYSAIVGDFYVGGNLAGLRAAIDASRGESLADAPQYEDAVDEVDDDALALAYVDPRELLDQIADTADADPQIQRALRSPELAEAGPVVGSLVARADEIVLEATGDSSLVGDAVDEDDAEVTVGELPGDSWLALATPPLGAVFRDGLDRAGVLDEVAAEVRRGTGLDLRRDLLDVVGGLGVFARGSSPLTVGGGLLLRTTSDAGARKLMTLIEPIVDAGGVGPTRPIAPGSARGFEVPLAQLPQPLVVLAQGAEIAAGYPLSSAQDLLDPQERFDESDAGKAAIETLGEGYTPSFVLIVPPVARLLDALDQLEVVELSDVLPYVQAYESLAVGIERDDDETTVRAVVALR